MKANLIILELQRYIAEIEKIHSRFIKTRDAISINRDDDLVFRQYVREIVDLLNDALGSNNYSAQILQDFNNGISNYLHTPSLKSVENILSTLRAAVTRFSRNPDLLSQTKADKNAQHRENIFIVHGRNEAKWRELKDILKSEFRLNPIVLLEQPNAGSETIIEKFERYAKTCSCAVAIFTPDDQVSFGEETYLQARPNAIYELGWFCGNLGRANTLLLLKNGTSIFSDFDGIVQHRFSENVLEKIHDIKKDLIAAGILAEI